MKCFHYLFQYATIFDRCDCISQNAAKREKIKSGGLCRVYVQKGSHTAVPTDAIPMVWVMRSKTVHIANNIKAVCLLRATSNPNNVATPFPPLPRKKIEYPLPNKSMPAKKQS